jgi:hypothetical protein
MTQLVELQAAQLGYKVLHSMHVLFFVEYVWVIVHAVLCEVPLAEHSRMYRDTCDRYVTFIYGYDADLHSAQPLLTLKAEFS